MLKHYSVSIPNSPRHSQKPEFLYVAGQWQCCHNQSLMGELKRLDVGHPLKRVRITLGLRQDPWITQEGGLSHCLFLLPDVKRLFFSRVKKKLHLCMRMWYLPRRSILISPKSKGCYRAGGGKRGYDLSLGWQWLHRTLLVRDSQQLWEGGWIWHVYV